MAPTHFTKWQSAVLAGLRRFSARNKTILIRRVQFISEELRLVASQVGSLGKTPKYTLSRVLQEFREMGLLHHVRRGVDLMMFEPMSLDSEDFSDKELDIAIDHEMLLLDEVPTSDSVILTRRRRGQERVRLHVLKNYENRCALCEVSEPSLLVASHIVRWADDLEMRGRLSNILCLCRMHDALFEHGFLGLDDEMRVLSKPVKSTVIEYLQRTSTSIRLPKTHHPSATCLRRHRIRTGFESAR